MIRRPVRFVAVLSVLVVAVLGCSSNGTTTNASGTSTSASTSSSYPAGKEQVCAARDQLKSSITSLAKPSLLTGGTAAITSALDEVQSRVDAVKTAAKQDYQPQIDDVETSLKALRTSTAKMGDRSLSQNLQTVGNDVANLGTAMEALNAKLRTACGS